MSGEKLSQYGMDEDGQVIEGVDPGLRRSVGRGAAATMATSAAGEGLSPANHQIEADQNVSGIGSKDSGTASGVLVGKHWWVFAGIGALLLTGLTVAGIYLVTKKPSTVDQLVILTVPSGADIKLDAKEYGHSPVKLEQLAIGTYTITISKEGYEPIVEPLPVTESGPVEYKLKPIPPADAVGLSPEEQIRQFQLRAEEAFARGYYGVPYEGSALYYADYIRSIDQNNAYAAEMRERVRKAAHQSAQTAISRGDLAQAQDVYKFLVDYYPTDEEALAAAGRLENQLARAMGQVRDLVRKADEALRAGRLADPSGKSAYFYSKQALAIDRQNERARQIRNQVKDALVAAGEQAFARGDVESGIKQLEEVGQLFPEDKQSRGRAREMRAQRAAEVARTPDPGDLRISGLAAYRAGNYEAAITDLQRAFANGRNSPDVVFALARSYMLTGHLDQAESLFREVRPTAGDAASYHSAIAALGDIAYQRGDSATAVERWKQARQLGGSTIYSVAALDDKIERIEKKQREKAAEPTPLSLQVKHLHGGLLGGSCTGTLTINATGARFDGGKDVFASSLVGVRISITKDYTGIRFEGNMQKFRMPRSDSERFHETLSRYQQTYSPVSK